MARLGEKIYTSNWGDELYAVKMTSVNDFRMSVMVYVVKSDEKESELFTIRRKDIFENKKCFDFLMDLECDFGRDDVDVIRNKVIGIMRDKKKGEVQQSKATYEEIYRALCKFIFENAESMEDNPKAAVFVRNGFGYMLSEGLENFVKENKDKGYNKLAILKRLKVAGVLLPGKDRPYDILVSVKGDKNRYYKICLIDDFELEEEAEEVLI